MIDENQECRWCKKEIGRTRFRAIVDGMEKDLCQTCFFLHINGGSNKLAKRVSGVL